MGGISRKKMETSQFPSQNESTKEVSSKLDNVTIFKDRGKILGGGSYSGGCEEFREKKNENLTNALPK